MRNITLQKAHYSSGWFLLPSPPSTSQCLWLLLYCMGTVAAQYFWKMEKKHLFCVLPQEQLVIAILLPVLHPDALGCSVCYNHCKSWYSSTVLKFWIPMKLSSRLCKAVKLHEGVKPDLLGTH